MMPLNIFIKQPSHRIASVGVAFSAALALIWFIVYCLFENNAGQSFFAVGTILFGLHLLFVLVAFAGNLLILLRYLLITALGLVTSVVWWWFDGEVYVAPFGPEYQTHTTTALLVTGIALSSLGCASGWFMGCLAPRQAFHQYFFDYIYRRRHMLITVALAGALFFGLLYLYASGGVITVDKKYTEGVVGIGFEFNVYNVFQQTCLALFIVSVLCFNYRFLWFFIAVISLLCGVLAGSRADYLPPMLILLLFYFEMWHYNRSSLFRCKDLEASRGVDLRYYMLLAALAIGGFFIAEALAIWRSSPESSIPQLLLFIFRDLRGFFITEAYGHPMFWMETANQMLGGMYGIIGQMQFGNTEYLWGQSYVDYILKLPPAFLGLERPLGLEWFTDINGLRMSQGGIFEPAEAFANFGLFGCFIISFLWSWMLASLLNLAKKYNSLFCLLWYLTCGLMLSRAVWYQNFAYVRIASIYGLIGLMLFVVNRLWLSMNPKIRRLNLSAK